MELRVPASHDDFVSWAAIKTRVVPDEPTTAEQLLASDEAGRLLLLAAVDGEDVGCGVVLRSGFAGKAFIAVRVLPEARRRGVGSELVRALVAHARALGLEGVNAFVDAPDTESWAFAVQRGLVEVDRQVQQARTVSPVELATGFELTAVGERREELLRAAWALAREAFAALPVRGAITYPIATWLRDEATFPDGSFVALEDGEIVGYAGLQTHAEPDVAEHGLTVVRRDRRGRGIGRALKLAQIDWASRAGIRELVTWTQRGNEAMQALNRALGYEDRSCVLTMQGPLPR